MSGRKKNKTNSACKYLFYFFIDIFLNHFISYVQIFPFFLSSSLRNDCLFYKSLYVHVNTIFVNVHYSPLPIHYSLLSFMIFIHLLKNLWLLFLEAEQHFVIWKPSRHYREQKVIANAFRRPCSGYLVLLINVGYVLCNSNHYIFQIMHSLWKIQPTSVKINSHLDFCVFYKLPIILTFIQYPIFTLHIILQFICFLPE